MFSIKEVNAFMQVARMGERDRVWLREWKIFGAGMIVGVVLFLCITSMWWVPLMWPS